MKKGATILLLIAVLGIWGILAYKIYNTVHDNQTYRVSATTPPPVAQSTKPRSSYNIHINNRDPFLSILTDTITTELNDTVLKPIVHINDTVAELPVFCGIISNKKQQLAILKYHNKYNFIGIGEKVENYKLTGIAIDHITVISNSKKINIKLDSLISRNAKNK